MEDSLPKLISARRENGGSGAAPEGVLPDDLTNLNWVAGIPVPMNTSVSPPEGCKVKKLFFGNSTPSSSKGELESPSGPVLGTPVARAKALKTSLPTYKIVLTPESRSCSNLSSSASPEKRDSVILANIVSSNGCHGGTPEVEAEKEEEDCMVVGDAKQPGGLEETSTEHDKPNCSYTCLIGMALKASSGCLPVNAIYQYIEREFPYFITAPDGWKNSVRHNLSLNPIFRKVNREGWTGKKGYLWEVCPDKQELVDKEILRFLHVTGKKLGEFTAPMRVSAKYKQRPKKACRSSPQHSSTPIFCSRCTRILSPTPPQDSSTSSDDSIVMADIRKYSTDVQKEILSSNIRIKPKPTVTQSALDTSKPPSKYIGLRSPPGDPKEVAREVFGLCSSPENSAPFYPMNYSGPFIPFYPQPGQFGFPYENFDLANPTTPSSSSSGSSSSSNSSNTSPPVGAPPLIPHYALPMPYYLQYPPPIYAPPHPQGGVSRSRSQENNDSERLPPSGSNLSVRVLSSSNQVEKAGSAQRLNGGSVAMSSSSPRRGDGGGSKRSASSAKRNTCSRGDLLWSSPDVAGLTSPLKRMKVLDSVAAGMVGGGERRRRPPLEDSLSAYFADISANSTCSDDEEEENEEVSSIMSLLLKSNQHQQQQQQQQSQQSHPETNDCPSPTEKFPYGGSGGNTSTGLPAMDLHIHHHEEDNYFLPSLDSLLNIGDDTILTLKTAMSLDIQGVVEIATEDAKELHSSSNAALQTYS